MFHTGIFCKSLVGLVLGKGSEEMEITGAETGTVGRVVCNLSVTAV
jgi:hypothetical protein